MKNENKQPIWSVFNEYAEKYAERYGDVSRYAESFDFFQNAVTAPSAKILGLGCGPGNVMAYLSIQNPNWKFKGIDAAENMIAIAKKKLPEHSFICANALDFEPEESEYNGVLLAFLLPYLTEQEITTLFQKIEKTLCKGGILYISTMIADADAVIRQASSDGNQHIYLTHYSAATILKILEEQNYKIRYTNTLPAENGVDTDGIFIAQKREEEDGTFSN